MGSLLFFIIIWFLLRRIKPIYTPVRRQGNRRIRPKSKGAWGEWTVAKILFRLPAVDYKILNDVMLRTEYGTTQMDHVVVSCYGIFVIETKNYAGWIIGGENAEQWTELLHSKK